MKNRLFIIAGVAMCLGIAGCSSGQNAKINAWGKSHKITLYSGGKAVKTWVSVGKVNNEDGSDGYYFKDASTNKLVTVSGDIVIEVID